MRRAIGHLVELQRLDDELHRVSEEVRDRPRQDEAIARARQESDERLASAEASLEKAQLELRHSESGLQDAEAQRSRLEGQQSQVKSNEAYTALLHEIEAAGLAASRWETLILEFMDAVEERTSGLEQTRLEVSSTQAELDSREKALERRATELSEQQARVDSARAALAGEMDQEVLSRYDRIAQRRRPAVAIVAGEVCLGCRVGIPPQLYLEVCSGEKLVTCATCKRILILPQEEAPGASAGA